MPPNNNSIHLGDAARLIGKSPRTVSRWYAWYENYDNIPPDIFLPKRYKIKKNNNYYIDLADVQHLKAFADNIRRGGKWFGCMAEFNAAFQWTKPIGERALANKGSSKLDYKQEYYKNFKG